MRKILLSLLLASVAAAPAAAQRTDRSDRDQARAERQQEREERAERRRDAVEATASAEVRAEARADRESLEQIRAVRNADRPSLQERQALREQRQDTLRSNRTLRQADRPVPRVLRNRVPVVSEVPQVGTQPPAPAQARQDKVIRWATDWRRNSSYDWYNWRNRHRSLFRLGFYYDPFGWGYQPYSIGWRMWPSYYRSSYWLNDPWQYRLPYAPAGTRWIRYYNDAILVDTWDGQVLDVIYNFFW